MSVIFDWSVKFLEWLGLLLGMSHKAISVPLFMITMSIQHPEHPIARNPYGSEDVEVVEHPIENAGKPLFGYLQRR